MMNQSAQIHQIISTLTAVVGPFMGRSDDQVLATARVKNIHYVLTLCNIYIVHYMYQNIYIMHDNIMQYMHYVYH